VGRLAERVPEQVDLERAHGIRALGGVLVEQAPGPVELLVVAVARGQLDDRERHLAAEYEELIEQVARHTGRIAQQALDDLQRRRRRQLAHECALSVPHLEQLEELEALERLTHDLPVHPERERELAFVRELGSGRHRADQDLGAELVEDAVHPAGAADGFKLHAIARWTWSDIGGPRSDHEAGRS
jgi:hypothetical protein